MVDGLVLGAPQTVEIGEGEGHLGISIQLEVPSLCIFEVWGANVVEVHSAMRSTLTRRSRESTFWMPR